MLGVIGVDRAPVLFGDADALNSWQHEEPVDGLADVSASAAEAGTVDIGDARLLCAMTSWGDGYFPVFADLPE
ncbi:MULTISPECIES: hypothetical protein [Streptomyces]|uniref:Uncharacterized protein n=1 Tax=Streptomyces sviceus (strain ATCC 29083 / DSM 924 / JCM 4929 / NBRC 13980 / NCIMB 11184 / NRRL 5439 / UC 5370) TaxID=463191 RepID=B5HLS7_STRX2|nr:MULTISPECIES: hypothetical protein [Streptomyces]EDY53782.1 conserved hypothetical protein [Streptomyces sviceus ATCC 29083]